MHDYKAQTGSRGADESHGSVVHDAGFSFEPATESTEQQPIQAPTQAQALQGLGTQFDHSNTILDHFETKDGRHLTNHDPEFIATWLRKNQEESADREDALFIPIDQRLRIMTSANIYEELHRAGLRDEELERITIALCQRGKRSMQRIFAILCMLALPTEIRAFMEAKLYDRHLPFTFKEYRVYRKTVQGQRQLGDPIALFQDTPWQLHLQDGFAMYQIQVCAPFFQLSWAAKDPIFHYSLKDSLILPFMRIEDPADDVPENPIANLFTIQGGTSMVQKVKIHPSHHNADPEVVSIIPKSDMHSH